VPPDEINSSSQMLEIREIFFHRVINTFASKAAIALKYNLSIDDNFKKLFDDLYQELSSQNKYNFYVLNFIFLELGLAYRVLSFKEVEKIKEKTLLEIENIVQGMGHFQLLSQLEVAKKLILLLASYYYNVSNDYEHEAGQKYLSGQFVKLFEITEEFNDLYSKECFHHKDIIFNAMKLFSTKLSEFIIKLKTINTGHEGFNKYVYTNLEVILEEVNVFFNKLLKENKDNV
jgi:hypothetical protein